MNKIQFFYDNDLLGLQQKINTWLSVNRDVNIEDTNLTALGKPSGRAGIMSTEKYVFYIRYTSIDNMLTMERAAEEEQSTAEVSHMKNIAHN